MTDLLHRTGFVYKKSKVVPGKAALKHKKNLLKIMLKLRKIKELQQLA